MDSSESKNPTKKSPFDDLSREELISKCKGLLLIAQKAKQAKSDYQAEVDKYKSQIADFENDKQNSLTSIKTLQELVDSLTEQKLNYITELDTLKSKYKSLDEKCANYEDVLKNYQEDVTVKEHKLVESYQKISDLDSELTSLKRQNNRLTEENEQLINQLTELEASTTEFNNLGLKQREQLQLLEQKIQNDKTYEIEIKGLRDKIEELEVKLKEASAEILNKDAVHKCKLEEVTTLYENEKIKRDKIYTKLKSYKEKILKCASCINQLKSARFILIKTVKEYSENIPKWQTEIVKASKILDEQMNKINKENLALKTRIENLECQLNEVNLSQSSHKNQANKEIQLLEENHNLTSEVSAIKEKMKDLEENNMVTIKELQELTNAYEKLRDVTLKDQINENMVLKKDIQAKISELETLRTQLQECKMYTQELEKETNSLKVSNEKDFKENLLLQVKALENEKYILVKEKLSAKDTISELENQNTVLTNENTEMKTKLSELNAKLESITCEYNKVKEDCEKKKDEKIKELQNEINCNQEQYNILKKENATLHDMNGLLKEEIETLKLSLEQPKDDTDNLSELNASLQADIVKLETKLSAYKQENSTLLTELKEYRIKMKEHDSIVAEYEDAKSKLLNYKTENNELLNEMKEINEVLKERGETISKLQKAVSEMETLIELEKDKDEKNRELNMKMNMLENTLKSVEMNKNKFSEEYEKIKLERDNALKIINENENVISSLKEELDKLKQSSNNAADLPNDDMSTSTISKAEEHSRMKDLDETFEDKYTKLRIFALKLKKKLNETTAQLYNTEQENVKLKKLCDEQDSGVKSIPTVDEVDSVKKVIEDDRIFELQTQIKTLSIDKEKLEAELAQKIEQLNGEITSHAATKQQLEKALRDVKKKNVLSLEMEDYEKSMKDLTSKMEEKKKKIVELESTIDNQEGTIKAMKTQIKLLEEQIKTEEAQNRLLKEELQQALQESKEKDSVIDAKKDVIAKLAQDLEDEKRKKEETDLETTALLSEKEKIIMNFTEEKIELNNKIKKLEFKCADLEEKLRLTNIELADLKTEYTSYKVRAQAVLRQNQTVDHSQEEQLKEESAALKAQAESLTLKINTLQDKYTEQSIELEAMRKRAAEASAETSRAHQRTARLQADLTRLSQQLDSERTQHKLQISTLTQCYKSQISEMETKFQKETDKLREQLVTLKENAKPGKTEDDARERYTLPVIPKDDTSDGELDINVSMIPREEGEGSESAPSPPLSKSFLSASRRSPVPLERLLEEGVPEDEALDAASLSLTPEQEIADLKRKVTTLQQRVKHVTVLLSESERECARLVQLSELLKSELRRVRGDTHSAHNVEYMKNVTLKFLTLPPGDERSRLVPVLQKILTLSSEEAQKIQAVAKGMDPNPGKGWGSYLPWPGGK